MLLCAQLKSNTQSTTASLVIPISSLDDVQSMKFLNLLLFKSSGYHFMTCFPQPKDISI